MPTLSETSSSSNSSSDEEEVKTQECKNTFQNNAEKMCVSGHADTTEMQPNLATKNQSTAELLSDPR